MLLREELGDIGMVRKRLDVIEAHPIYVYGRRGWYSAFRLEVVNGLDDLLDFHRRLHAFDDFLHGLVGHGTLVDAMIWRRASSSTVLAKIFSFSMLVFLS